MRETRRVLSERDGIDIETDVSGTRRRVLACSTPVTSTLPRGGRHPADAGNGGVPRELDNNAWDM